MKGLIEVWKVSIPDGFPRPFSRRICFCRDYSLQRFQFLTDSLAHLAISDLDQVCRLLLVSIPDGFPRPFSHRRLRCLTCKKALVSIPDGFPRPFSRVSVGATRQPLKVSIPHGFPRPFSLLGVFFIESPLLEFQFLTDSLAHLA